MELAIIIAVVVVALIFDYTNGFHDAANAIATSVSTRALTPRVALMMAAVMNFIGAFLGQKVAQHGQRDHRSRDGQPWPGDRDGGPARRDHLEPDHVVLRAAVVLLARADRWPRRRGPGCGCLRQLGHGDRQGRHPDGPLAARRLRARLRRDAGDHVDLPPQVTGQGRPGFPARADRVGSRDGAGPRPAGRTEDDGRHLPGAALGGLRRRRRPAARLGDRRGRDGDLPGHLLRRLADHAHPRAADHPPRPAAGFRRRVGRGERALHHGVRLRGADLDHAHHHQRGDGRGRRRSASPPCAGAWRAPS